MVEHTITYPRLFQTSAWQSRKSGTLRFICTRQYVRCDSPKMFRRIDHQVANLCLLEQDDGGRVALYGFLDDPKSTTRILRHSRVSALKIYYSHFRPSATTETYQYFPKLILEETQYIDILMSCIRSDESRHVLIRYLRWQEGLPRLKICLAYLSLTKSAVHGFGEVFVTIA